METENSSNMTCKEKIKQNYLSYILKFFLYSFILLIVYFLEKLLFNLINFIFYFWFISIIIQIILHLCLLRYLVLTFEFPLINRIGRRIIEYKIGEREASYLFNNLKSLKSSFELVFSSQKPVEELKHLSLIYKNVKDEYLTIKAFYTDFNNMKIKYNKLTLDQNIFYQNIKNLFISFEQSEFLKLLSDIIKKLRKEKKGLIKDLSNNDKEKFYKAKKETEKYLESIQTSSDLVINQMKDYLGEDYYFFYPRYIRNFFKNELFASIQEAQIELESIYELEEKKLKTKDGNILDYIIIKGDNNNDNNNKNLIIICGPNAQVYQMFSRSPLIKKYLDKGIDVLCWNYRGYGFSTGKATFDNLKTDIIEIYDEIKKLNIYKKIGVHGISIGGVPCCYLANQRKEICLLVSDRNFGQIEYIVKDFNYIGLYLVILYKYLFIPSSRNVENYMDTNAYKIILNDPNDEVVNEVGSLKTLLSEEFCNRYLDVDYNNSFDYISNLNNSKDNSIELETLDETNNSILTNSNEKPINSKDNLLNDIIISPLKNKDNNITSLKNKTALDVILLDNKKEFIENLIYIKEALNNKKLIIQNNTICNKILKKFKKEEKDDDEYIHLKEEELENSAGLCDFILDTISICLKKFRSSGDNLFNLINKKGKYNQNLFIENFFNNLFIWGTYEKQDTFGCLYHSTEYIDIMLSEVIRFLNSFLSSQEIASFKKINIIKNIETFYNHLIKIKTNMRFLGIKSNDGFVSLNDGKKYEKELIRLGRGNLVSLDCGHNNVPCSEEIRVLYHYLNQTDIFKKGKEDNIINKEDSNNFGNENIFDNSVDLDSSISNLN